MRGADEDGDATRLAGDLFHRPLGGLDEPGPEQQVLRGIAGHRQLGKEDELRARLPRVLEPCQDPVAVPVEVSDDGIDLCQRQSHGVSLSGKNRCQTRAAISSSTSGSSTEDMSPGSWPRA